MLNNQFWLLKAMSGNVWNKRRETSRFHYFLKIKKPILVSRWTKTLHQSINRISGLYFKTGNELIVSLFTIKNIIFLGIHSCIPKMIWCRNLRTVCTFDWYYIWPFLDSNRYCSNMVAGRAFWRKAVGVHLSKPCFQHGYVTSHILPSITKKAPSGPRNMCNYTTHRHKILKGNEYEVSAPYLVEKDGRHCQYISSFLFPSPYSNQNMQV